MSAAAIFASEFAQREVQTRRPWTMRRFVRKLGAWGFAFFALKGLAWLVLPVMAMYFA
jgi:hypothetical protein